MIRLLAPLIVLLTACAPVQTTRLQPADIALPPMKTFARTAPGCKG